MKIHNNYDCEKCLNKSICKYYDNCKKYSNKDLFVKSKKRNEDTENLIVTITCEGYRTNTLLHMVYPEGVRTSPDFNSTGAPLARGNITTSKN